MVIESSLWPLEASRLTHVEVVMLTGWITALWANIVSDITLGIKVAAH